MLLIFFCTDSDPVGLSVLHSAQSVCSPSPGAHSSEERSPRSQSIAVPTHPVGTAAACSAGLPSQGKKIYRRKHKTRSGAKSQRCGWLLLKPERKMECVHKEEGREWGGGGSAIAGLQPLPSPCRAVLQLCSPAVLGAGGSSHQQCEQQGRDERSCAAACTVSY